MIRFAALALGVALLLTQSSCKRATPKAASTASRVVSVSASTTETLFAIGAGSKTVGRSRYCDYPPEATKLPVIGGYVDPNLEAILGLSPDLVVGARGPLGPGLVRTLEERGIATYFPETETLEEIFTMISGIGARTGHTFTADQLVNAMRTRRDAITKTLANEKRPRVLLLFAKKPISVTGPKSFPDEMIKLAGGTNVIVDGTAYPTIALEKVIALDPDTILDAEMGPDAVPFDSTWDSVRAVREGKVARVTDEAVLRPGPRVMEGVATLARALHPGVLIP